MNRGFTAMMFCNRHGKDLCRRLGGRTNFVRLPRQRITFPTMNVRIAREMGQTKMDKYELEEVRRLMVQEREQCDHETLMFRERNEEQGHPDHAECADCTHVIAGEEATELHEAGETVQPFNA